MQAKTLIAAALAVPLLVIAACDRDQATPTTASRPTEDRQATAPSSPERTLESAPPAAGVPPSSSSSPATDPSLSSSPSGSAGTSGMSPSMSTPPSTSGSPSDTTDSKQRRSGD